MLCTVDYYHNLCRHSPTQCWPQRHSNPSMSIGFQVPKTCHICVMRWRDMASNAEFHGCVPRQVRESRQVSSVSLLDATHCCRSQVSAHQRGIHHKLACCGHHQLAAPTLPVMTATSPSFGKRRVPSCNMQHCSKLSELAQSRGMK